MVVTATGVRRDAVLDRHDVDVEAVAAIGGKRDAGAIGRPRRLALDRAPLDRDGRQPPSACLPSGVIVQMRSRYDTAMRLPSGDHAGSCTPLIVVCARLGNLRARTRQ